MIGKLVSASVAAMIVCTAAPAVVVPNGSFETPVTNSVTYNSDVAGVDFNLGSGVQRTAGYAAAPDGAQTGFLQSTLLTTGAISFTLSDLVVGNVYQLVFSAATRPNVQTNPFTVTLAGQQIGSYTVSTPVWTDFSSATFTANNTSSILSFTGSQAGFSMREVGIDNVRVNAVPEPATWSMMIGGFLLVGTALRRRNKNKQSLYLSPAG